MGEGGRPTFQISLIFQLFMQLIYQYIIIPETDSAKMADIRISVDPVFKKFRYAISGRNITKKIRTNPEDEIPDIITCKFGFYWSLTAVVFELIVSSGARTHCNVHFRPYNSIIKEKF